MSKMDRFADINEKYVRLCRRFGINAVIEAEGEPSKVVPMEEHFVIRINLDAIPEGRYEEYLAYNMRRLIMPRLRLETERLLIRRLATDDAEPLFESFSDEESSRLDTGSEPFEEMEGEYLENFAAICKDETRYAIVERATGRAIGLINLTSISDRQVETMEIGYCINPSRQRRGFAFEAVSAMLRLLLEELRLDMVLANCVELNAPSRAMQAKLGFEYEGRRHKGFWDPAVGKPVDLLCFYKER